MPRCGVGKTYTRCGLRRTCTHSARHSVTYSYTVSFLGLVRKEIHYADFGCCCRIGREGICGWQNGCLGLNSGSVSLCLVASRHNPEFGNSIVLGSSPGYTDRKCFFDIRKVEYSKDVKNQELKIPDNSKTGTGVMGNYTLGLDRAVPY